MTPVLQRFYHQQNQLRDKQDRRNQDDTDKEDPFFSQIPKYRSPYSASPPAQSYIPTYSFAHRQTNIQQLIYSRSPSVQIDPTPTPRHPFTITSQIPTTNPHDIYQHRKPTNGSTNSPKHQFFYNASPGPHRRGLLPTTGHHPPTNHDSADSNQLPPLHPVYSRSPPDRRVYPTPGPPVAKSIERSVYGDGQHPGNLDSEPKPDKGRERLREDQGET